MPSAAMRGSYESLNQMPNMSVLSGYKLKRQARLRGGVAAQSRKKLTGPFGVLPSCSVKTKVVAPRPSCQPHLLQGFLKIDDDLAAIGEGDGHHVARSLGVYVSVRRLVDAVAMAFYSE